MKAGEYDDAAQNDLKDEPIGTCAIPEEIIVEILSRLPLHSLPRFTCVSKQWSSLISTITATKTRSPVVLLVSHSEAYSFSPHAIDQHQEVQLQSVRLPAWEKKNNISWRLRIMGSCNGLLLVCIDEDLFLWNPLTRFFRKVLAYDRLRDEDYRICAGLSYDSTRNEYKAVLALAHSTPSWGGEFVVVGCFRHKSWTTVYVPYRVRSMNSGPIVDGKLHWFASKKNSGNHFLSPDQIIYFNAHMDKFEEVPMPEARGEDGDIICTLGVLDGCLCMSRFVHPGNSESNVEVLIMKQYGVKTSWTILFTASSSFTFCFYNTFKPLGYTKNGEILSEVYPANYRDRQISAFNFTNNTHRRILALQNRSFGLVIIVHEESLVTPTDHHWEEEELEGEATYMELGNHYHHWEEEELEGEATYMELGNHYSWKMKKNEHGFWSRI